MGKEQTESLIKELIRLISALESSSYEDSIELLFQISWRAIEIDWGEKFSKIEIITEREWRSLEGLVRVLLQESLLVKEHILDIKQELIQFIPKLEAFQKSEPIAPSTMPRLFALVEYANGKFYLNELKRRLEVFFKQRIDANNSYHVKALFRMLEIIGEYLKWLSPELKPVLKNLVELLPKIRDKIQHRKYRAEKAAKDQILIDGIINKDLQTLHHILNILPANRFSGLAQIDPSSLDFPLGGKEQATGVYKEIHDSCERRSQQRGKPKCEGYTIMDVYSHYPLTADIKTKDIQNEEYPYISELRFILEESTTLPFETLLNIIILTLNPEQKQLLSYLTTNYDFAAYFTGLCLGNSAVLYELSKPHNLSCDYQSLRTFIYQRIKGKILAQIASNITDPAIAEEMRLIENDPLDKEIKKKRAKLQHKFTELSSFYKGINQLEAKREQILTKARASDYTTAKRLAREELDMQESEWEQFVQQDQMELLAKLELCSLIMKSFNITAEEAAKIIQILINLHRRMGEMQLQKGDQQAYNSFLAANIGYLLKLNPAQMQLWKILSRQATIDEQTELLALISELHLTQEQIETFLSRSDQIHNPSIWRYIEFNKFKSNATTQQTATDTLYSKIEKVLDEFRKLGEIAASYPYNQKKYDRLSELFAESSPYYLAVQKLFEELEDAIVQNHLREDQIFLTHEYKSITLPQLFLIKQIRNQIAHRPEALNSECIAWFFTEWLGCAALELKLRQKEVDSAGITQLSQSSVSSLRESNPSFNLEQIAAQAKLIRNFAISLGFCSEISLRGRIINDSIGIQSDLDLIVKFKGPQVPKTNIFALGNLLSQYLGINVQVFTEEMLQQQSMVTMLPGHIKQICCGAKDLLAVSLHFDKKKRLSQPWHHLNMQNITTSIKASECIGKVWTPEEIDKITTILVYPDTAFLEEQIELRRSSLTPQVQGIIHAKAQKFAELLNSAISLCDAKKENNYYYS